MNMMSPLSRLDAINMDNPYKDLMERMREARDEEDRDSRESEGIPPGGPPPDRPPGPPSQHPPFSILSPQMLNMMDRMKGGGGGGLPPRPHSPSRDEDTSPMNLSSERDDKPWVSEGSIPQSPSPGSTELTSPSNPQTSPNGGGDYSPHPADHHRRSSSPPHP